MNTEKAFPSKRSAALARLNDFAERAGQRYASDRNADLGPDNRTNISMLSPYLRHRIITEHEVVNAVLARHTLTTAEKFVQEVLWRTYWKGWLEMRPSVWTRFMAERDKAERTLTVMAAEAGTTGIEGFDDWARELVATGYLHNHARMWFASIWIFTLKLPWTLGADFFLRHLLDADPASNTLSWRWVAGLQTAGKTYLATADNIARYTGGRFAPKGLATHAVALNEAPLPPPGAMPHVTNKPLTEPYLLLVHGEDLNPETCIQTNQPPAMALVSPRAGTVWPWGEKAATFVMGAAADTAERLAACYKCPVRVIDELDSELVLAMAETSKTKTVVTAYAAVGPVADGLGALQSQLVDSGVTLTQHRRSWDERFWPHAKKGFFPFREYIAEGLLNEQITHSAAGQHG